MASNSELELYHNMIASDGHMTSNTREIPTSNDSSTKLDEAAITPFENQPEYATGLRLTIIITTICFSTLLTALDLVST